MIDKRKIYWLLVIVGAVGAIGGIVMRKTGGPDSQHMASLVGWTGIALLLLARLFFKPRPNAPQDVKDLFPPKKQG
ncbi:MAG: hypothetical protein DMG65_09335 [Candidatus Angelobacter sp. Gp1-AA117]|nr:MAG: hypothetical protein DMG65_09335 [Candidatus Angelobacter sp. Gp1-AA117]